MSAIRRAIIDEEAGEMTLSTAEPQTADERSETKQARDRNVAGELRRGPEAGLFLSV